jgi:hypothetical protein
LSGADLSGADLTGACINDWRIDANTSLCNVVCDFIFVDCCKREDGQIEFSDRYPAEGKFELGEFARWAQLRSLGLDQ